MKKIWNWIKNIFKPQRQDLPVVLHEEVENKYTNKDGKPIKCGTHNRYKKSCPICKEIAGVI
jgi:hypothetical protein